MSKSVSLSLLAFTLLACLGRADTPTKPNVLFIAVDDLKPLLGCYGDSLAKTPNIDRLARRGVVYERAFCNQAVCAPSRNALLSGLRPQTVGIYDLGTNFRAATPDAITLPQAFKNAGYRTEAVGKLFHVGHGNHEDPASWSVPHYHGKTVDYELPENRLTKTREEALFANEDQTNLPKGAPYESADVPDETYSDGKIAAEAVRRIQAAAEKPNQPFFLAVGFLKPHMPFCAPKKYWDQFDPSLFQLADLRTPPVGAPDYAPTNWAELRNYTLIPDKGPVPDEQQRTLIHAYYATASYADAQLGKVLDELDRTKLSENTIIVLWGDHGWHLGDHGMWSKHTNYEQAARIPFIVLKPNGAADAKCGSLVESVDIYPTLCELAGIPTPPKLDGRSFVATLTNPQAPTKEAIFHSFPRGGGRIGRAVRTERYRLVEWKVPGASAVTADLELYDYQADPAESKNLAPEQPEVVKRLRELLAAIPEAKPQIKHNNRRDLMFYERDIDGDNKLTREEFLANQTDPKEAPKRFTRFDVNKDGVLSREEYVTRGGEDTSR